MTAFGAPGSTGFAMGKLLGNAAFGLRGFRTNCFRNRFGRLFDGTVAGGGAVRVIQPVRRFYWRRSHGQFRLAGFRAGSAADGSAVFGSSLACGRKLASGGGHPPVSHLAAEQPPINKAARKTIAK